MKKPLLGITSLVIVTNAFAFDCYITVLKDSCWVKDYEVRVLLTDVKMNRNITEVVIPKGQSWGRSPFVCDARQQLAYSAIFSPTIWEGQENDIYKGLRFWILPDEAAKNETAWNLQVRFPKMFAGVPSPKGALHNCRYDETSVTPIAVTPPPGE